MPNVILRHRKNGPIADSDWFSVDSYTKVDIDTIDDSSGNTPCGYNTRCGSISFCKNAFVSNSI